MNKVIRNNDYLDAREIILNLEVPRDRNLVVLKLIDALQIDIRDINVEILRGVKVYLIRYNDIQFQTWIDESNRVFAMNTHFDVIEDEEIVESY